MTNRYTPALLLAGLSMTTGAANGVTWEEQAERLQNVSATLLDAMPLGEPTNARASVQAKMVMSLLPKINPTVGGKSEDVPSAPVHALPILQADSPAWNVAGAALTGSLWGGYLPPGGEKLFGLTATAEQSVVGGHIAATSGGSWVNGFMQLGSQLSRASIHGGITEPDAHDKFRADSQVAFLAMGASSANPEWPVWVNASVATKTTDSTFFIPSDQTKLNLTDRIGTGGKTPITQVAAGYDFAFGLRLAAGYINVPGRLAMPRALAAYRHTL